MMPFGGYSQTIPSYSVLITEILFDPSPAVELPDFEFVELYNNSPDTIDLNAWQWQVGDRSVILPSCIIAPYQCIIICSATAESKFEVKKCIPPKWLTLTNSGQYLVLKNEQGTIIHFADYSPSMFNDALKRDGGWSLELTCLERPCDQESWQVSEQKEGGSPGYLIRDDCTVVPHTAFKAIRCGYISSSEVLVFFNRPFFPATQSSEIMFRVGPSSAPAWSFFNDRCDQVIVELPDQLADHEILSMNISGDAFDCNGQKLEPASLFLGIPEEPDSGDIIISEILFDQDDTGLEFIELYNNSDRLFDLSQLIIATLDDTGFVKDFSRKGDLSFLLFPDHYAVICTDLIWFKKKYKDAPAGCVHIRKDMPVLSNYGGHIRLMDQNQQILDEAKYDPGWHNDRLSDTKGVSLERINNNTSGVSSSNWYSAAASSDYATPGCENSQRLYPGGEEKGKFTLMNELVTPDQDGFNDQAVIMLNMGEHGYMGRFEVRTPSGFLIRLVQDWDLLPSAGQLCWDGLDDYHHHVTPGIYILIVNYADSQGHKGRWKMACGVMNH